MGLLRGGIMEEKVDVKQCITDLYILLNDESCSLLQQALDKDYSEDYKACEYVIEKFECMVDEINRLWRLVLFHDALESVSFNLLQCVIDKDFSDIDFSWMTDEDLIIVMEKCNKQLGVNDELFGLEKEVKERWEMIKDDKKD